MAETGEMTPARVVWFVGVPLCLLLAVLAVVVIVKENVTTAEPASAIAASQDDDAAPTVVMEKLAFGPRTLVVAQGAEVLFDNKDVAPHTVTADEGDRDSGIIDPGAAFRMVVNEPFAYHCAIHPSMTAEIQLEG